MVVFGLAEQHISMWWITIGLGGVVVAVVIVLLSLLTSLVKDIEVSVDILWETATTVARNTATTWMLDQTAVATADLGTEVTRHADLLQSIEAGAR
jgi:ABC-type phosphonate transport system ATPase subunit